MRIRTDLVCPDRTAAAGKVITGAVILTLVCVSASSVFAAGPVYWDYPENLPLREMDLSGVALDRHGRLVPGLTATELLADGPDVYWRAVPDGRGGCFIGSGHDGQIWRIDTDGQSSLFAEVPDAEIFSLLRVGEVLYVGCGPQGHLFTIDAEGTIELRARFEDGYIWSMTADDKDRVYLATGAPAAVYRVDQGDDPVQLSVLPAFNALDIVWTVEHDLLVVTQGPGLIYSLDSDRPSTGHLLYEADQDEVRQLLQGPDNLWYALALAPESETGPLANGNGNNGSNGNGFNSQGNSNSLLDLSAMLQEPAIRSVLYRIKTDGLVVPMWESTVELLVAAYSDTWGWLGGGKPNRDQGKAVLLALEEPGATRPLATWSGGDLLDLLVRPGNSEHDRILACLANPGLVCQLEHSAGNGGIALASPLDGGQPVRWGRLGWRGDHDDSELSWSVRGGARSIPDDTWTDWSESWTDRDHEIDLPPSRFLQWRVEFNGGGLGGYVEAVTVSAYEPNRRPRILELSVENQGEIMLGGLMSRSENVTENFKSGLRAEYNLTSQADRHADLLKAAKVRPLQTVLWHARDPNGDRLLYQLDYRQVDQDSWRSIGQQRTDEIGTWDTATVPDGMYVVRLQATDSLDNPVAEALQAEKTSLPFQVDNTQPEISGLKLERRASGFRISLRAEDATSSLAGARLELPDGTSERLDPRDRICDSRREDFALDITFPRDNHAAPEMPWRIRVLVADRHGNTAVQEGEVR